MNEDGKKGKEERRDRTRDERKRKQDKKRKNTRKRKKKTERRKEEQKTIKPLKYYTSNYNIKKNHTNFNITNFKCILGKYFEGEG